MPRDTADRLSSYFLNRISKLSHPQQLWLCCFQFQLVNGERTVALIEQARQPQYCPHCHHGRFHRFGISNDLQRYRCLGCRRTFNALTGTPLAKLRHKTIWLQFCQCLLDPATTVRSAAERTGVHRNTSFRWRHRFLDWIKHDRPLTLQGIVEADETFIRESQKGSRHLQRPASRRGMPAQRRGISREQVAVVVARDRSGRTVDFIAGLSALTAHALTTHLLPKLERDVLLVSDANAAYKSFASTASIAHRAVNLRKGVRTIGHIHMQNVNGYHGRFKQWLIHFRGVATRYLSNYLGWRWAIDQRRLASADQILRAALGVFNGPR